MLHRLSAEDNRFRTVTFRPGLNLLVARTTAASSDTDSRNGTGKSSLVELLHFLLGAAAKQGTLPLRPALRDTHFSLSMDWPGSERPAWVSRRGSKPKVVTTDLGTGQESTHLFDFHEVGEFSVADWTERIERDLFRLPPDHPGISGRAMLSLLMRRVGSHAFNDPVRTFPQQSASDAAANLAYLLGLDWRLAGSTGRSPHGRPPASSSVRP